MSNEIINAKNLANYVIEVYLKRKKIFGLIKISTFCVLTGLVVAVPELNLYLRF